MHQDTSNSQRIELLREFPVAEMISAPGHQRLRHPKALIVLSHQIARGDIESMYAEPILLNVVTTRTPDGGVEISTVEIVDGNHRLAAALHAGSWIVIGDIPPQLLRVWVDGRPAGEFEPAPRWIPLEVARASCLLEVAPASCLGPNDWFKVPSDWGPKGPTAAIRGDISAADPRFAEADRGIPIREVLRRNLGCQPPPPETAT
ncbi:MAG: hypothetical protein ACYTGW_02635 [Planctomycetota bacterium]|jgi:hypothetical protein